MHKTLKVNTPNCNAICAVSKTYHQAFPPISPEQLT